MKIRYMKLDKNKFYYKSIYNTQKKKNDSATSFYNMVTLVYSNDNDNFDKLLSFLWTNDFIDRELWLQKDQT